MLWVKTLECELGETGQIRTRCGSLFESLDPPAEVGFAVVAGRLLDERDSHGSSLPALGLLSPNLARATVAYMSRSCLNIALVTEVFFDDPDRRRLTRRLAEARAGGADLAVLPELPLDPWFPATRDADPRDAEEPCGRRYQLQADAARAAGIAVLGGAIIRDPETGKRHNTALLFDGGGSLLGSYQKVHLPFEEDFWEAAHYEPGTEPPTILPGFSLPLGIQICSDANRTSGCQLLAAQGVGAIIVPRATPAETWPRWRMVLRADAVTSAAYVVTVNRPSSGSSSPTGGPSAVVGPDGGVIIETTESLVVVTLDPALVARAREAYPGYLDFHPGVHEKGWHSVAARGSTAGGGQDEP
jgi:predicted amidohydrolase